jgi:hypothetical protein
LSFVLHVPQDASAPDVWQQLLECYAAKQAWPTTVSAYLFDALLFFFVWLGCFFGLVLLERAASGAYAVAPLVHHAVTTVVHHAVTTVVHGCCGVPAGDMVFGVPRVLLSGTRSFAL